MKNKLLQSFFFILSFWWTVLFVLFSLEPSLTVDALTRLGRAPDTSVSALNHLKYWIDLLEAWTIPMVGWLGVSMVLGFVVTGWSVVKVVIGRKHRETGDGEYRGIKLTLGEFPQPVMLKSVPMKGFSASGEFGKKVSNMTPEQLSLLKEIFEVIAAYPDAFPGDGHGVTLLEHTINVVEKILNEPDSMPLAAVAAAAHDVGKITAFKMDGGEWKRVKAHDKESGKWLALLPSWWKLPEDERNALVLAVKYDHSRGALPTRPDDGRASALAMQIIQQVSKADCQATKEEKQKVLDAREVDTLILQSFVDELPRLTWQDMGLPPGVKAVGWKVGKRLYFLESQLRERCLAVLDPDLTAALGGFYREKGKIAPFSIALMKVLNDQGWLVKQIGKIKVPDEMPLWKIKAGSKEFSAIIAIDVPDDMLDRLPPKDTSYVLEVVGPHVVQPGSVSTADISLDGVLSSGKKTRPKVEKQKPGQPRDDNPSPMSLLAAISAPAKVSQAEEPKLQSATAEPQSEVSVGESTAREALSTEAAKPEASESDAALDRTEKLDSAPHSFDDLIPGVDELQGKSLRESSLPEPVTLQLDQGALETTAPEPEKLSADPAKDTSVAIEGRQSSRQETEPAEGPPAVVVSQPEQAGSDKRVEEKTQEKSSPVKNGEPKAATTKTPWLESALYKEKPEVKKADKKPDSQQPTQNDKAQVKGDGKQKKPQGKEKQPKGGFMDGLW